ncbi:GUN4 domain-containing protein [Dendronalium sp. ChiSLP03b]|uniref:GUN4 domain-containing protein n=1 Tax=Dendronalium sp. ChiSLP03b TaxID=3075381 RepID=UPI002AD221EA|nr:GUN4 domain-containing protein [Dendronalium sp. ChiSLP03b]MDZ8203370.1 GUN4 domain-containing protein [Dendronalium sp. ChiSLP03b]
MAEESLKLFFSYSHKDESLRDELSKHLTILEWQGVISSWHDRKILPGEEWDYQINDNLDTADIILLLVSSDFLFSKYCWDVEVKKAIERHHQGEACVIPVILRPVDWTGAPFAKLQALPKNAEPVVSRYWHSQDEAFTDVAKGIRAAVEKLKQEREKRQQEQEAERLQQQQETERLQRQREQEEAERLQREQEAERLQSQQEKTERIQKQQEAERLKRQQEQEAKRLRLKREQEETDDLSSEKGVDYTRLRDLLKAGNWKEADRETLKVMRKVAGREKGGSLEIELMKKFPCTDLRTIDQLWVRYSNGRFGFSVQKKIWLEVGQKWNAFYTRVGWQIYAKWWFGGYIIEESIKSNVNAPMGHLPMMTWKDMSFETSWLDWTVGISSFASRLVNCNI